MPTILVVEDDRMINEVVSEYLKDAEYGVISAENGSKAAELIENTMDIDLFILDIMLPGVSGLTLLKMIRGSDTHKLKPIIMLTALTDEQTQLDSFNDMTDDYVTKPFSPKILIKRVEALLRRSERVTGEEARTDEPGVQPEQSGNMLRVGHVSIDIDRYLAFEDDVRIPLTLKEFELLKAMMSNPRMVLTRQRLLDLVWGYDYFGDERIVDVHIKNLRKKFKVDPVTTVKGVGYCI